MSCSILHGVQLAVPLLVLALTWFAGSTFKDLHDLQKDPNKNRITANIVERRFLKERIFWLTVIICILLGSITYTKWEIRRVCDPGNIALPFD